MGYFNQEKLKQASVKSEIQKKHHTLLLVDDEEAHLQALSELLGREYELLFARDGSEGLELVQNHPEPERIHLILCDQRMPKMTGVEFLALTIPIIPKAIRIVLTGYTDVATLIDGINEGQIYKFLVKPFEPQDLRLTIQRALETFELERKNAHLVEELKALNASLEQKVEARTAELKQAFQTIKAQQDDLNQELENARETQLYLLPQTLPQIPNTQVYCKYEPIIQVGGDFYNVFHINNDAYGLLVADVTGHGPSAALIAVQAFGAFAQASEGQLSTRAVTESTNQKLCGKIQKTKFVSMFYSIYDAATQQLTYTSCGHPPGLILRPSTSELIPLKTKGTLLGIAPGVQSEEERVQLFPGDKVVFYTDAIIELRNQEEKMLREAGLQKFLKGHLQTPIQQLIEAVYQLGLEYSEGIGFEDDFTMIGLEIL